MAFFQNGLETDYTYRTPEVMAWGNRMAKLNNRPHAWGNTGKAFAPQTYQAMNGDTTGTLRMANPKKLYGGQGDNNAYINSESEARANRKMHSIKLRMMNGVGVSPSFAAHLRQMAARTTYSPGLGVVSPFLQQGQLRDYESGYAISRKLFEDKQAQHAKEIALGVKFGANGMPTYIPDTPEYYAFEKAREEAEKANLVKHDKALSWLPAITPGSQRDKTGRTPDRTLPAWYSSQDAFNAHNQGSMTQVNEVTAHPEKYLVGEEARGGKFITDHLSDLGLLWGQTPTPEGLRLTQDDHGSETGMFYNQGNGRGVPGLPANGMHPTGPWPAHPTGGGGAPAAWRPPVQYAKPERHAAQIAAQQHPMTHYKDPQMMVPAHPGHAPDVVTTDGPNLQHGPTYNHYQQELSQYNNARPWHDKMKHPEDAAHPMGFYEWIQAGMPDLGIRYPAQKTPLQGSPEWIARQGNPVLPGAPGFLY